MILNVHLNRKTTDYELSRCNVALVRELSHDDFTALRSRPLDDYVFITGNKDKLNYENDSARQCIMFLDSEGDDGILVDPQGYDYARYSAYVANARQLCILGQYPALQDYNKEMEDLVTHYVGEILKTQKNGDAVLSFSDVGDYYQLEYQGFLDQDLFQRMMEARPEFDDIEENCGDLFIKVHPKYQTPLKRVITQQELDVICAKHTLWLNNAGGEQANLQNCRLSELNLYGKDLSNSNCEFAEFQNCLMCGVNFSNAEMESTKFEYCNLNNFCANHANFIDAEFSSCNLSNSVVNDALFTNAKMTHCNLDGADFINCQLDGLEHRGTELNNASVFTAQTKEQANQLKLS